jgi:hypothetical protein
MFKQARQVRVDAPPDSPFVCNTCNPPKRFHDSRALGTHKYRAHKQKNVYRQQVSARNKIYDDKAQDETLENQTIK